MSIKLPRDLRGYTRLFWALVVVTLPVTSFKYFPFLDRDTMVRPLSFYPLAVLLILLLIRWIRGEMKLQWNGSLFLFVLFLGAALTATVLGVLQNPVPMHGQEILGRSLRAWVTLLGGLAFFVGALLMNQNEEDLRFTLRWLYVGLAASILWGAIQMFSYYTEIPGRATLNRFQTAFSIRKLLIKKRATGFAYEPSWLASQLATVYLPWLFASLLTGYRVYKRRWVEPLLFAGAVGLLLMTYSRGGVGMTAGTCLLVYLFTQGKRIQAHGRWLVHPWETGQTTLRKIGAATERLLLLATLVGLLGGVGWFLSQNPYFARIWSSNKTESLQEYLVDISAGPRLAYLEAGWGIYQDHPLTGVGLGASGMYLYDYLPQWSLTTISEITRQLTYHSWLYPNPKNLFIRILAETGILGFGLYLIFLLNNLGQVMAVLKQSQPFSRFLGISGLATWIVLLFYNFTQDSFIDPNGWFSIGLFLGLAVGCWASSRPRQQQDLR